MIDNAYAVAGAPNWFCGWVDWRGWRGIDDAHPSSFLRRIARHGGGDGPLVCKRLKLAA